MDKTMADYSTPRVQRHRLCLDGNHSRCRPDNCAPRAEIELQVRETIIARSALDYLSNNKRKWSELGGELPDVRAKARRQIPSWLADEFTVTYETMVESAYWYSLR